MAQQPMDMLPPELQAEQEALLRRQRVADMMTQRGQMPIQGGMAGRAYVGPSWSQGLAQLANAYLGGKTTDDIGAAQKNIAGRYNDMYADEVARLSAMRSGSTPRPSAVDPQEMEQSADQGTALPGPVQDVAPASRQQMMDALLASKIPAMRNAGMAQMNAQFANDLKDDQVVVGPDATLLRGGVPVFTGRSRPTNDKTFKVGDTRQLRQGRNIITQEYQADGSWKEIAKGDVDKPASVNVAAPVTPVTIADPNDPTGRNTIVIDGRTRAVLGKGPKMTEGGKIDAKSEKAMAGLSADLQTAEDLLNGVVRTSDGQVVKGNLPTGSGIGSLYDSVAGFVGASPSGAAEADSLKVVSARLVGKVPRFEGPQSDKDTMLYKEAAGNAGNDKLPRDRRLAAIRTMREIYAGYETGERGRIAGAGAGAGAGGAPKSPTKITNDAEYNALPSGTEFIAPDGSTRRKP